MKIFDAFVGIIITVGFMSCGNAKQLQYLQGNLNADSLGKVNYREMLVQTGDILSITVFSDNPTASAIYNQATSPIGATVAGASSASNISGYLVDKNGNIQMQALGNVYVKGMTREQVALLVANQYKEKNLLTNPYCQVRFTNFKVTVLGEVNHPAAYSIPTEKVNVLELLSLAGDLTNYARRDSILVIREIDQQRKFGWLDVRSKDIFNSEFFYLQQNDMLVVNATKNKAALNDQVVVRNIGLTTSILSTIAIIITLLRK